MKLQKLAVLALAGVSAAAFADTRQDQIVDRIVAGEQQFLTRIRGEQPLVEAYVQELDSNGMPVHDHYKLMRLDLAGSTKQMSLTGSPGFAGTLLEAFRHPFTPRYFAQGWLQMAFVDLSGFNQANYKFRYLRREFLGNVRCLIFEVQPTNTKSRGRFIGNIWVEDRDYQIVRFNGTYTHSTRFHSYLHFDSWRVNVAPDQWTPAEVYVETGSQPANRQSGDRLKGQVRFWGYAARRGATLDELSNITIDSKDAVDDSSSQGYSPWQKENMWERQAERNVIGRLERSGLLAPKGGVDQVLDTVVNNLQATNHIDGDVTCRILLTTPLEAFTVGNTIVISKGLVDVLPDEASLAMVLSSQLANIALGARVPTIFAFGDQTIFPDREILARMNMQHTEQQSAEAVKKALEILGNSPYKDKLAGAGLFLKALDKAMLDLPNLVRANLGDQVGNRRSIEGMEALMAKAPALNLKKLDQEPALPLGSRVMVNPWDGRTTLAKTERYAFKSPQDKMSFEITPVMLPLTRAEDAQSVQDAVTGNR